MSLGKFFFALAKHTGAVSVWNHGGGFLDDKYLIYGTFFLTSAAYISKAGDATEAEQLQDFPGFSRTDYVVYEGYLTWSLWKVILHPMHIHTIVSFFHYAYNVNWYSKTQVFYLVCRSLISFAIFIHIATSIYSYMTHTWNIIFCAIETATLSSVHVGVGRSLPAG